MKDYADILLVGQTPPPYHGQSVVTAMLFDNDWADLNVERLQMSYSDTIDDVGKAGIGKVLHLLSLILQTWKIALTKRPAILYYLPASANRTPVIRDIIYLGLVRWCFSKTIFHYHAGGLPAYLDSIGMLGRLAKYIYSHADASIDVIKTEPPTGSYLKSKVNAVARNGVDVIPVLRQRKSVDIFQILYVGMLNEGKGILQIIETAKLLKERNCKFECKVVGCWSAEVFRKEVEVKIENDGLESYFLFTGSLNGEDKWQAYADADCFFFPSHYEAETFGMVLVEAMAFSIPLVTTRWSGIPLVVEGGNCALLCDVKSPVQFADALEVLSKDPAKRKKMGNAAKLHYGRYYTREKFVGAMEGIFRGVLKLES
jgi:glycosyltransferase involved in cell wall biosynthesis